jgi:hypothetical protein
MLDPLFINLRSTVTGHRINKRWGTYFLLRPSVTEKTILIALMCAPRYHTEYHPIMTYCPYTLPPSIVCTFIRLFLLVEFYKPSFIPFR